MKKLSILLCLLLAGCAPMAEMLQNAGQPTAQTVSTTDRNIEEYQLEPYNGPKARVAVYRFTDRTAKGGGGVRGFYWYSAEIGSGMADMLNDALLQSMKLSSPVTTTSGLPSTVVVKASAANLRDAPGTDGQIITTLRQGERLSVQGEDKGWYFVQTKAGKEGWISKSLAVQ